MSAGSGAELAIAARAPEVAAAPVAEANGEFSLLLFEPGRPDGSWAACDFTPGSTEFEVTQYGRRRLWDEVSGAYLWWLSVGRPEQGRFGLTVSADAQTVWLDHPKHRVSEAALQR